MILNRLWNGVVLKGLQLAAAGIQCDAPPPERVRQIDAMIGELVHDLDEYDDVDPALDDDDEDAGIGGSGTPVLCLAGRRALDAANMALDDAGRPRAEEGQEVRALP